MILKSFKESAYKIVPFETVSEWKGIQDYTVHHFFCEFDIFREFFRLVVKPGSTVVDAGLNFGIHTDCFIELGAKNVIAFEPSNEVLKVVKSKYKNENRVKIIPKALSDKNGFLKFHECNATGASSLKYTRDIEKHGGYTYRVEATRLDDEAALQTCDNISCMKMDIEGAEISALSAGQKFLEIHQPYIIIEYVDTLKEYSVNGKKLDKYAVLELCKEIKYVPYNLYGMCVLSEDVFEQSIFRDTNDLILVPESKHEEWSRLLLPRYQYAVFDILFERIELHDSFPGNLSIMSMCRRIYRVVNQHEEAAAREYLALVHRNLTRVIRNHSEIDDITDLRDRGRLLIKLIYFGAINEAYELALLKEVGEADLQRFAPILETLVV